MTRHFQVLFVTAVFVIAVAAIEGARFYRFLNPTRAGACDCIQNIAMATMFLFIAKINLVRIPQSQNLALFAALAAGFFLAATIEKTITLFWK